MKYNRKVELLWQPTVEVVNGRQIRVTTGNNIGNTRYECAGKLEVWCAVTLIRELRKALRKIRDEEVRQLNEAVSEAEGSL